MNRWFPRNRVVLARSLAMWLPLAVLFTMTAGLIYAAAQQIDRTSANDPQVQIATDAVLRLDRGASATEIARGRPVDLASSLNTHVTVYGAQEQILASTARLNRTIPRPPIGVLTAVNARDHAQNWLTWQPQPGVRVAAVVAGWRHGAVLVGRSLRLSEDREADLEQVIGELWLLGLIVLAAASYGAARVWPVDRRAASEPE